MSVHPGRNTGSGSRQCTAKEEGWREVVKTALVKQVWLGACSAALNEMETPVCLGACKAVAEEGIKSQKNECVSCIRLENPSDDCSFIYQGEKKRSGKGEGWVLDPPRSSTEAVVFRLGLRIEDTVRKLVSSIREANRGLDSREPGDNAPAWGTICL